MDKGNKSGLRPITVSQVGRLTSIRPVTVPSHYPRDTVCLPMTLYTRSTPNASILSSPL
ncbi:uncharacterized protein G2W53_029436 [Senna tora]|uniref:Uncharacterized protein n=1 Tax=Senna tora TaxID=362788 RepID=A0A834WAQ0_9FABA|nr:uncharacterized protein G2W53_029436 [Senna tora]